MRGDTGLPTLETNGFNRRSDSVQIQARFNSARQKFFWEMPPYNNTCLIIFSVFIFNKISIIWSRLFNLSLERLVRKILKFWWIIYVNLTPF